MPKFEVVSEYQPSGDQPQAIAALAEGIENGLKEQALLGVTGSGKTFTMAKVIEQVQRPTLVLAHNKTLAAQLCAEFKEFFPNNAVEYFVSYYDYYQPEAYIPHTDTYIEKDCLHQRRDRPAAAQSATCRPAGAAGRDRRVLRLLHLRPGRAGRLCATWWSPCGWGPSGTGTSCCAAWWRSATSATTSPLSGTCSGSGGTRWRSTPPTTGTTPSGWSSSGTRSTASARSTRSPAA